MTKLHHAHDYTAISTLHDALDTLEKEYGDLFRDPPLNQEVHMLRDTVDAVINGSPEAEEYLYEHGQAILEDVQRRLAAIIAEQTRFANESPAATGILTGRAVDRARKASASVSTASELLTPALEKTYV